MSDAGCPPPTCNQQQAGAQQVWPDPTLKNCEHGVYVAPAAAALPAYCDFFSNPNINVNHWNMNSYSDVENVLSPPSSPWTQSTLAPQLPLNFGPESGGTPIAGSLCDTMFNLASDTGFTKTIIFETDGAENDSQYLPTNGVSCAGQPAAAGQSTPNYSLQDWGFAVPSVPSGCTQPVAGQCMTPAEVSDEMDDCIGWEAKIARYATYYPAAGNSIATDVECVAPATTQNPPLVEGINWLVGAVNDGYVPLNPDVRTPLGGYQPQVAESIIRANLGQPVTLAAATPAVAGSTSINVPAVELDLYQSLGQSTPNSQFELLVSVPGTVYGVAPCGTW